MHFCAKLGNMLVAWNRAEYCARQLLNWQCDGPFVLVLTAEMGSVAIRDTIFAIATHTHDLDLASHLDHFANYFDILREYRNYYAHGVTMIAPPMGPNPSRGIAHQLSARQGLKLDHDPISFEQLDFVINHAMTLASYGYAIPDAFRRRGDDGIAAAQKVFASWPEKPPQPPKLRKNRAVLGRLPPPPESSPE
jgi:hypothetical protein